MEAIKGTSESGHPTFNKELYKDRVKEDPRMLDKESLIATGKIILSEVNTKQVEQPLSDAKNLDLASDFWNFKLANGLQSLRKGFYRIVDEAKFRDINGVQTLSAYVLYSYGDKDSDCNLYFANIGTLVNKNAVAGNLTTGKFVSINAMNKKQYLTSLKDRTIYVSRSEPVDDSQYGQMKEVLWFVWD